jgi:ribulose-5-phosphate 4-epimerase/fuculose-1-phosphate aldolase
MRMSYAETKHEVALANRMLAELGLATGVLASLGHTSRRVPGAPDLFVVKGRGYAVDALAAVRPEDMVVCNLEGRKVDGPPGATQCFEVKMHSCIYKMYPDVGSVTHVHPRFTVLMSVLQATLRPMCQEGIGLVATPLPVYPHVKTVQSDEEGTEVATLLAGRKAILLEGHGATTVGATTEESVMNMLHLEEQARMNWYACCAAGAGHRSIPLELIDEMSNRPPLEDLPHFRDVPTSRAVRGVWQYYTMKVAEGLETPS